MHYVAPLQGHTDAAWRRWHSMEYCGTARYFTPFIRVEKGVPRDRDVRDYTSTLNVGVDVEPQVIFDGMDELHTLVRELVRLGARSVNLNMGCPFPLQTGRGRGAGILAQPARLEGLGDLMAEFAPMRFSVKMRLGYDDPGEWRQIMPILNRLPLEFVAVHPRTARQQYSGSLYMGEFGALAAESAAPVIFNGEIRTPADIAAIMARYPGIAGVMTGRGVLGRPSLLEEYDSGCELAVAVRIARMLRFHDHVLAHYARTLCGDAQILSKIKPFWEYAGHEIGRKVYKAIRKAGSMSKYLQALTSLRDI